MVYPQMLTGPAFIIVICFVVFFSIMVWLALRSGHDYSVHDTQAHSTDYADVIKEGHGGMTAFLWFSYAAIIIWVIFYLWQHIDEFARLFAWG
jgi:hypothetical protein